jgi:DNA-binding MarR family transcriptional regulator
MNSRKQFGDLIIGIDKQIKMNIERDLKQYEIGIGLLQILLYLFSNADQSVSQIDLVKFLKIDKGNISRSIAKLIDRDYLEQDPKNPKTYKLSKKGIQLQDVIISKFTNLNQTMMKGINEADLNTTINTLSIVMKNLEDLK